MADSSSSGPPPLPAITLTLVGDAPATGGATFLHVRRVRMTARYPDGTESEPFVYDAVERRALDAVVVVAHYREHGERYVYLRSALRPPLLLRPFPPVLSGSLWELPAGLVEPDETPAHGASRELHEELGFEIPPERFLPLGPPGVPAPAMVGELHYYFHVAVDPAARKPPTEDGSALERGAAICAIPLSRALDLCRSGELYDEKTELALRRLEELP